MADPPSPSLAAFDAAVERLREAIARARRARAQAQRLQREVADYRVQSIVRRGIATARRVRAREERELRLGS